MCIVLLYRRRHVNRASGGLSGPGVGEGGDGEVVGVKALFEENQRSDPTHDLREFARLILRDVAPKDVFLAVAVI